jgi:hypothetical protein
LSGPFFRTVFFPFLLGVFFTVFFDAFFLAVFFVAIGVPGRRLSRYLILAWRARAGIYYFFLSFTGLGQLL